MNKRYAIVGLGGRSRMYYEALADKYRDTCALVGFCDVNRARMAYANEVVTGYGAPPVPMYGPEDFDRMIAGKARHRDRHLRRPHPPPLHHPRDGARLRRHHREADDRG